MQGFHKILERAAERKGGHDALMSLMPKVLSEAELASVGDERYLALMTRCIFQAGFVWRVIKKKWPQFEEAFNGFDIQALVFKAPEDWDAYLQDTRIVRNGQKIYALKENAQWLYAVAQEQQSFAKLFAEWPLDDQIGLLKYFKQNGKRLGGMSGQYFIRFAQKDGFVLASDVVHAMQLADVDIKDSPTSQRDMKKVQEAFNEWHVQTGLPYTVLSRVLGYSTGNNVATEIILERSATL